MALSAVARNQTCSCKICNEHQNILSINVTGNVHVGAAAPLAAAAGATAAAEAGSAAAAAAAAHDG